MDLRERAGGVLIQAKGVAEGGPIVGRVDVRILDDDDGLALPGVAGGEERVEVVDGGEVAGDDGLIGAAARGVGVVGVDGAGGSNGRAFRRERAAAGVEVRRFNGVVKRVGAEVMEADHAAHDTRKSGGDLGVGDIGDVRDTVDRKLMDLGTEGGADHGGGAGEVDGHAGRGDGVDFEAAGYKPRSHGGYIGLRGTELLAELGGREPLMKVGGSGVRLLADVGLKGRFALGRTLQLQDHVVQGEGCIDRTTIVRGVESGGADVADEGCETAVVDVLRDDGASVR